MPLFICKSFTNICHILKQYLDICGTDHVGKLIKWQTVISGEQELSQNFIKSLSAVV